MSEIRSTEERIAELDKKMEQIKAQKKAILQREKEIQRKARTKRLIEVGGAVESVLGHPIEKRRYTQSYCLFGTARKAWKLLFKSI